MPTKMKMTLNIGGSELSFPMLLSETADYKLFSVKFEEDSVGITLQDINTGYYKLICFNLK